MTVLAPTSIHHSDLLLGNLWDRAQCDLGEIVKKIYRCLELRDLGIAFCVNKASNECWGLHVLMERVGYFPMYQESGLLCGSPVAYLQALHRMMNRDLSVKRELIASRAILERFRSETSCPTWEGTEVFDHMFYFHGILVLWGELASAIQVEGPSTHSFGGALSNWDECIRAVRNLKEEVKEFPRWFEKYHEQLSELKRLDLAERGLSYLPKEIGHLSRLQELRIENNNLIEIPGFIGDLKELTDLSYYGNPLKRVSIRTYQLTKLRMIGYDRDRQIDIENKTIVLLIMISLGSRVIVKLHDLFRSRLSHRTSKGSMGCAVFRASSQLLVMVASIFSICSLVRPLFDDATLRVRRLLANTLPDRVVEVIFFNS